MAHPLEMPEKLTVIGGILLISQTHESETDDESVEFVKKSTAWVDVLRKNNKTLRVSGTKVFVLYARSDTFSVTILNCTIGSGGAPFMKTDTPAAPAAPEPPNEQSLFLTLPSPIPLTDDHISVAQAFGNGIYKATIEEAIALANMQSATAQKNNRPGIVYIMGVVAIVKPKQPIEPLTIVTRFDFPCSK